MLPDKELNHFVVALGHAPESTEDDLALSTRLDDLRSLVERALDAVHLYEAEGVDVSVGPGAIMVAIRESDARKATSTHFS
jgi:hypothetical protein